MLFWLFVLMVVVGLVLDLKFCKLAGVITWVIGALCTGVSCIVLLASYAGLDGYIAAMHERYDILVYQLENDIYENDNDIGKYEWLTKVQDWNEDLVSYQANQNDFWIGIFIPDIFDQFEPIPLELIK